MGPRGVLWGTIGILIIGMLVTSPLVGFIDVTKPDSERTVSFTSSGTASLTVPDQLVTDARFSQTEFGAGIYQLKIETAGITVDSVSGKPELIFQVRIPALGFSSQTITALNVSSVGQTINPYPFPNEFEPARLNKASYNTTITIMIRGNTTRRVYQQNVTVPVSDT